MTRQVRRLALCLLWAAIAAGGSAWLAQARLTQLREGFETDARIVHRLLSQQAVQNDAILDSLNLLQPAADGSNAAQRLPSVYPRILRVLVHRGGDRWSGERQPTLDAGLATSRTTRRTALVRGDFSDGRYWLVLAGQPASFALQLDLRATVPWDQWPMDPSTSQVRVLLSHAGQELVLQPGSSTRSGWHYAFAKTLASPSQPFEVQASRDVGWDALPWWAMVGWSLASAVAMAAWEASRRQREARRRAEELLRLGQVARLNTMGELAAGMAHELNQPLTALLANAQATQRLLREETPDLETAQSAIAQAVLQARRAADVVGRLRRLVERPDHPGTIRPIALAEAAQEALHLLAPELERRAISAQLQSGQDLPDALADPVALQQIIHNLLMNAAQALESVPESDRKILLQITRCSEKQLQLSVRDQGAGLSAAARERLFEPFYSTRSGGLGLGLPLCESLAQSMGASLTLAQESSEKGAEFLLLLPSAEPLQP